MNLICCISNCPLLLSSEGDVYSSHENLHRRSTFLFEKKLSTVAQKFTRRSSFVSYEKNVSEDFERISIEDCQHVSSIAMDMKDLLDFLV